jgi:hypothetical protein
MTAHTPEIDGEVANRYERVVTADQVRIEAYVRSLAPPPGPKQRQEDVLDRLDRLEQHDTVDETTVSVWGAAICLDGPYRDTAACRRIESRIERFRQWARQADCPVSLPFETQSVTSTVVDDQYERLVPPQVCLAVHTDEDLQLVLPCEIDGQSIAVCEALDWLEADAAPATGSPSQSTSST